MWILSYSNLSSQANLINNNNNLLSSNNNSSNGNQSNQESRMPGQMEAIYLTWAISNQERKAC